MPLAGRGSPSDFPRVKNHLPTIEILEARIAPAIFFVSPAPSGPNALKVLKADGSDAQDTVRETAAKTLADSTVAIELAQGDQLVFDTNKNLQFDKGDRLLAEVFSGSGIFFLTDGVIARKAGFELTELTGLAVSAGFSGHVHADINGAVATALDVTGFNPSLAATTSLDGLTIDGQVKGSIMATGSIAHLSVGSALFNAKTSKFSVDDGIFAGDAIQHVDEYSFNGGGMQFETAQLTGTATTGGAGLSYITLKSSTFEMIAGKGNPEGSSNPGSHDGGSIDHVVVRNGFGNLFVFAGDGGEGAVSAGKGGAITDSTFTLSPTSQTLVRLIGGFGGSSAANHGGDAGAVDRVTVNLLTNAAQLAVLGGDAQSVGGNGGAVSHLRVHAKDLLFETPGFTVLTIRGGEGQSSPADGIVAHGGNVDHVCVGFGGPKGDPESYVTVVGGRGGFDEGASQPLGIGGSVSDVAIALLGKAGAVVVAGDGGSQGGSVTDVRIHNFGAKGEINVVGGDAAGGLGGDVSSVHYTNYVSHNGGLNVRGGRGDQGGSVHGVESVNLAPFMDELHVEGGDGSATVGGNITDVISITRGALFSTIIFAGHGVQAGGAVSDISLTHLAGRGEESVGILPGGAFVDADKLPVNSSTSVGSVSDIHVYAPLADVEIGQGSSATFDSNLHVVYRLDPVAGNSTTGVAPGGDGSDIQRITGTVGTLVLVAPSGGSSAGGAGGKGGSVSDVQMTVLKRAEMVAAGDGGNGLQPGLGGSLTSIDIQGDIGDFKKPFSGFVNSILGGMGGLIAGQGGAGQNGPGLNGSITDVSATRIAAIFAGRTAPAQFSAANAVQTITRLQADVLGADTKVKVAGAHHETNEVGTFDFTGGSDDVFTLGTDTPVDGLVIVRANGLVTPLPVAPLKLVLV
jgi:hypothetical protein